MATQILYYNVGPNGSLNTDRITRALLQHRNTPLQDIGLSPAQLLYGRNMKDCLPTLEKAMQIRPEWRMIADDREKALAKRNIRNIEMYNTHTKELPPLKIGDDVSVQNQTGPRPTRWEKTGVITELGKNRNYIVKMHGSGRCTLRNRQFLRKILPVCTDRPIQVPSLLKTSTRNNEPVKRVDIPAPWRQNIPYNEPDGDLPSPVNDEVMGPPVGSYNKDTPPDVVNHTVVQEPRRSARNRQPRQLLSLSMKGKHYDYVPTSN